MRDVGYVGVARAGRWKTTGRQLGTNNQANRATSSTGRSLKPSLCFQGKAFKRVNRANRAKVGPVGFQWPDESILLGWRSSQC